MESRDKSYEQLVRIENGLSAQKLRGFLNIRTQKSKENPIKCTNCFLILLAIVLLLTTSYGLWQAIRIEKYMENIKNEIGENSSNMLNDRKHQDMSNDLKSLDNRLKEIQKKISHRNFMKETTSPIIITSQSNFDDDIADLEYGEKNANEESITLDKFWRLWIQYYDFDSIVPTTTESDATTGSDENKLPELSNEVIEGSSKVTYTSDDDMDSIISTTSTSTELEQIETTSERDITDKQLQSDQYYDQDAYEYYEDFSWPKEGSSDINIDGEEVSNSSSMEDDIPKDETSTENPSIASAEDVEKKTAESSWLNDRFPSGSDSEGSFVSEFASDSGIDDTTESYSVGSLTNDLYPSSELGSTPNSLDSEDKSSDETEETLSSSDIYDAARIINHFRGLVAKRLEEAKSLDKQFAAINSDDDYANDYDVDDEDLEESSESTDSGYEWSYISKRSVDDTPAVESQQSQPGETISSKDLERKMILLQEAIDNDNHFLQNEVSLSSEPTKKLLQAKLNRFYTKMEAVSSHIDRLHDRFLRLNKLNDDYVSREFPSNDNSNI